MDTGDRDRAEVTKGPYTLGLWKYPFLLSVSAYILCVVAMLALGRSWRAFQIVHGAWYAASMAIAYISIRSGLIERMKGHFWTFAIALFALSLVLHLVFLLRGPALSQDIMLLEARGERLLDGQFPYRDFQPNKPPLYVWLVGGLSWLFGTGQIMFRVAFSMVDAAIPLVMLLIARDLHGGSRDLFEGRGGTDLPYIGFAAGALMYALNPIPLLEVGWAGHFDPTVVLTTLLAFWALARGRPEYSGLMLGAGLSLKMYPLFLIPVFALGLRKWKDRFKLVLSSLVVPVISSIPILLVDPRGILGYFEYQTVGWYSGTGLRTVLEIVLDLLGLPTTIGFYAMTGVLAVGASYICIRAIIGGLGRKDLAFLAVISAAFGLMLLTITYAVVLVMIDSPLWWIAGGVIVLISLLHLWAFGAIFFRGPKEERKGSPISLKRLIEGHIPIHHVPFVSTAVLLLLLLVSAQFHPWYLLWILPFLSCSPPYWSWSVAILFGSYQSDFYLPGDVGHL